MSRRWTIAIVAAGLYLAGGWALGGLSGLVRTVTTNGPERTVPATERRDRIDLIGVDPAAGGSAGVVATWTGVWEVPKHGLYDLVLEGHGHASWTIDGQLAHDTASGAATQTTSLRAGFRQIQITYAVDRSAPHLVVAAAPAGRPPKSLDSWTLKPAPPRNPRLRAVTKVARSILGGVALVATVWAIRKSVPALGGWWRGWLANLTGELSVWRTIRRWRSWAGRAAIWTALVLIVLYGALLRIDAITGRYGPVASPQWLAAVQTRSFAAPEHIRPAWIRWEHEGLYPHRNGTSSHYYSDPHSYLEAGRQMKWFYGVEPTIPRDPVFPFATKVFLKILNDQDVAVSFASAFFSTLAIWFTFLLGAALWSRPAGLLAAAGLALDFDVISLASRGWRDDAYMAALALCAYLTIRWWRAGQAGGREHQLGRWRIDAVYVHALGVGVAGGLAILTRITAVSFLAAGLAGVVLAWRAPWRRTLGAAALAGAVAVVVAAPYYVNWWRVTGDPFHTFNIHASVYSLAEGKPEYTGGSIGYIAEKFEERPIRMIDTVARGLTTSPFLNKWQGLDPWRPGLAALASAAALAGLVILAWTVQGRLVLFIAVVSAVPFAFTWTVDPDYRFTEHVYPVLLVAAAATVGAAARLLRVILVPNPRPSLSRPRSTWLAWAGTVGLLVAVLWFIGRVGPSRVFAEALKAGEDATLVAGDRDATSFTAGWSRVIRGDNVSMRVTADEGELSIRLPEARDFTATLRMDPFPRPLDAAPARLPVVEVLLNDVPITRIPLRWTPDRVGTYGLVLPHVAVQRGVNRLVLRVTPGDAVGVWYIRVHGAAAAARVTPLSAPRQPPAD